jgi:hypothetical protein
MPYDPDDELRDERDLTCGYCKYCGQAVGTTLETAEER